MNKIFILIVLFVSVLSSCANPKRSIRSFKSFAEILEYYRRQACDAKENFLTVYNYDGTEYTPKIMNPCEFQLDDYKRQNLCYISMRDRVDGINLTAHTQIVKSKMDEFINNMGSNSSWSDSPDKATFVLEVNERTSIQNLNQYLMALSVIYEEVLHFKYRKVMKGIPIILTSQELYSQGLE